MPNGSSVLCTRYAQQLSMWLDGAAMAGVHANMRRDGVSQCSECGGVHMVEDLVEVYRRGGGRGRDMLVGAVCVECSRERYRVISRMELVPGENGDPIEVEVPVLYHVDDNGDFGGNSMPNIMSYNTDPLQYLTFKCTQGAEAEKFRKGVPQFFLGAEIEAQVRSGTSVSEASQAVHDWMGDYAIMVTDGSVVNGFEIVTAPATLDYHVGGERGVFGEGRLFGFDEKRGGPARLLRAFNTDCCGLHVHVSKNALTPLDIIKIVTFVNCDSNQEVIERISGRRPNRFCERTKVDYSKVDVLEGRGSIFKSVVDARSKYSMVNLGKPATVEFRNFRGNVRAHGIFRALEFVESLCYFVKSHTLKDCKDAQVYFGWLNGCNSRYRHLWLYLVHSGLIEVPVRLRSNVSRWSEQFGVDSGDSAEVVIVGGVVDAEGGTGSASVPQSAPMPLAETSEFSGLPQIWNYVVDADDDYEDSDHGWDDDDIEEDGDAHV